MYKYNIIHRSGSKVGHADALSRLPLTDTVEVDEFESVNTVEIMSETAIDFSQI